MVINKFVIKISFLLLFISMPILGQNSFSSSIVRIYGFTASNVKMGTGSFINIQGKIYILTCYHNINACEKIEVYSNTFGKIGNVKVAAYDNIKDIALLSFTTDNNLKPPALQIKDLPSNLSTLKGITIGHPNGITEQKFEVRFTSEKGIISSKSLLNQSFKPIFKLDYDFDVIPIDLTIYGGMSGAPVILNSSIIGIVSGSINTGGSIGWAIPANYSKQLYWLTNQLSNTLNLSELKSIKSENKNIFRSVNYDGNIIEEYSPLDDILIDFENNVNDYIQSLSKQNMSIESAIQKIGDFDPQLAYTTKRVYLPGSVVYSDQIVRTSEYEEILELIRKYESEIYISQSKYNLVMSDITTFNAIKQQIVDYNSHENENLQLGIDSSELEVFNRKVGDYVFKMKELETKITAKGNQKSMQSFNCDAREYNPSVLITDCKSYLGLTKDENKYSIELAKIKLNALYFSKIYLDLIYEAKRFKD